jgi:bacteriocin-like protein
MKKVNLKGVSETLSEKELKNVMGGVTTQLLGDSPLAIDLETKIASGWNEYRCCCGMGASTYDCTTVRTNGGIPWEWAAVRCASGGGCFG